MLPGISLAVNIIVLSPKFLIGRLYLLTLIIVDCYVILLYFIGALVWLIILTSDDFAAMMTLILAM